MITDELVDDLIDSPIQLLFLLVIIFSVVILPIAFALYMTTIGHELIAEIIISSTGMLFNIFLFSSIYDKNTVIPITSSIPYATLLFIRVMSYGMLGLWIAAGVSAIGAVEWLFLCLFRNNLEYE